MSKMNDEGGPCYFCHKQTDNDFYCYGCKEYICEGVDCGIPWSVASMLGKGHDPEDHQIDENSAEADEIMGRA